MVGKGSPATHGLRNLLEQAADREAVAVSFELSNRRDALRPGMPLSISYGQLVCKYV